MGLGFMLHIRQRRMDAMLLKALESRGRDLMISGTRRALPLLATVSQHPREHLRRDPQGRAEHLPHAERLHPQG